MINFEVTKTQHDSLERHKEMVLETNKYMNLTSITDPAEFDVKHIADSMALLPYIPPGATLGDVGSGAGFPGVVLGIMRDDIEITLIDSLRKRVIFLEEVVRELGLANVWAIHARAEDLARGSVQFDVCTARAVASMDKLAKWVLPIVKPGGLFLAMKGPAPEEELEKAKPIIAKKGGAVEKVDMVEIAQGITHSVVVIRKKFM